MHHVTSVILSISSLLGTAMSAPTRVLTSSTTAAPTHVAPSTCTTYFPSVMRQLDESVPNVERANTAKDTKAFHVAQSVSFADNIKFDHVHQHVVFDNIASGSWDCQLMISWPSSAALNTYSVSRSGDFDSGPISLDVYSASYNASSLHTHPNHDGFKVGIPEISPFTTWQSMANALRAPTKGHIQEPHDDGNQVSVTLTRFGTIGVSPGEYGVTINSMACPQARSDGTLQFLFEIPDTDTRNASVSFLGSAEKGAGVYLLANC